MWSIKNYIWLNAFMFQVCWFVSILASATMALCCTVLFLIIHFSIIEDKFYEVMVIGLVSIIGYSFDLLFSYAGFIELSKNTLIPFYLFCIWVAFATTLNSSTAIFIKHKTIAVITGLLAPISYLAAQKLGKIEYSGTTIYSVCLHAVIWVALMLIIHHYVNLLKKYKINAR
jgi:hypothetical protein